MSVYVSLYLAVHACESCEDCHCSLAVSDTPIVTFNSGSDIIYSDP